MSPFARILALAALPLSLAACQTPAEEAQVASASEAPATTGVEPDSRAHALAQAACGGCHSVEAYGLSPVTPAPEWPMIANTPGLTRDTLKRWLSDAHNYPEDMDFYLDEEEVNMLVDYMLTLRRDDYKPSI